MATLKHFSLIAIYNPTLIISTEIKGFFMKKGPKIVVLGAGSYFFGKPVIYNTVTSPVLREGTLALVDPDSDILKTTVRLAERAREATGSPLKIEAATDRKEVLKDADFVVLSFSFRNAYYRGIDTRTALKYGITMCSSDTIGPGGIFRALREIPEVLRVAEDVRNLAGDAWLINYINPSAVIGIALMRHAPQVRSFALCDGNHLPYVNGHYMKMAEILPETFNNQDPVPSEILSKADYRIAGVNHCTWLTHFTYDGRDVLPNVRHFLVKKAAEEYETAPNRKAKPRLNFNYALQLFDLYGAYCTAPSHTKEYVPFFQGYGVTPVTPEPLIPFDCYNRAAEMAAAQEEVRKMADGRTPIAEFLNNGCGEHATDVIESMWGNLKKEFFINGPNQGAVTNLPDDAFLELRRTIDMNGFQALPYGEMPRGILGLTHQILDTHELTVEAALRCDRTLLLRALCTDPIVNNIGDARNIMNELLEAERCHLPQGWFE